MYHVIFIYLWISQLYFYCCFLMYYCGWRTSFVWHQFLQFHWNLFYGPTYGYTGKCAICTWGDYVSHCCSVNFSLSLSLWTSLSLCRVLFTSSISLLISYPVGTYTTETEVLKYPTITAELSIFLFNSICFCFVYFEGLVISP